MNARIERRAFLILAAGFVALTSRPSGILANASEGGSRNAPNIVFIMADDLGYGDLGCYGQEYIQTPHIDSLARGGMRFTQCYAGSSVCAPSRSVLMTGQHTGHTTVRNNSLGKGGVTRRFNRREDGIDGYREGLVPLKETDVTVAEVLRQSGYATGMSGKWGLGESGTTGVPNRQGFDEFFGYLNQKRGQAYYPPYLWHNRERVPLEGNKGNKQRQYSHDEITDFALEFIRANRDRPFFLYVPYCVPHRPYVVPSTEPYAKKPWRNDEKAYAAMITRMDRDVGRVINLLKELDVHRNTVVFFCSDNGAAENKRFNSNGPLRGGKRDLYEGGIRTPMIVHWPERVAAGSQSDLVWYFADVLPTLAAMADTEPPEGGDGVSILPTLLGKEQNLADRFFYWELLLGDGLHQAVRWRDWKAVVQPGQPMELYHLSGDIGETRNVAAKHSEVVARIEEYLKTARTESPAWPVH